MKVRFIVMIGSYWDTPGHLNSYILFTRLVLPLGLEPRLSSCTSVQLYAARVSLMLRWMLVMS
jgi:hypothetical protein